MKDLKEKDVAYVSPNDDLRTLLAVFFIHNVSHVPVLLDNKLMGIVSKTDVTRFMHESIQKGSFPSLKDISEKVSVKELMTQPIVEAQMESTTMSLLEKLIYHDVGSLVIKNGDQLVGILTEKDMIRYCAKTFENDLSFTEKMSSHIVQWLDSHGIIKISRMLGDIGI